MRLIIVEDNPGLLLRLSVALNDEAGISVVGSFETAEDALAAIGGLSPDVMLVDIGLPGMSGVELIRAVRERMPNLEMIAHTVFDDREVIFSALKAGASGYILKGSRLSALVEALQQVREGGAPMSPTIARKVVREFQSAKGSKDDYLLSPREKGILKEIEIGLTYKQIGIKLNISHHTVNVHVKNIYHKLHAKDRTEALRSARKKGIL
jgi:DNA-binding NarL/FixJ family response regulator